MSVSIAGPEPEEGLPGCDLAKLRARAEALLAALAASDAPLPDEAELSISLVGDAQMAALNEQYRGRSGPTDVLSFSLLEGDHVAQRGALLGDVVIDLVVAARQADEIGHELDEELLRLLIHGTLHLIGYDHEEPDEAAEMEARERALRDALA